MIENIIKEMYNIYQEYKNSSLGYKDFCDLYVQLLIQDKPQNQHENYFRYWETLKKYGDNMFCVRRDEDDKT